MRMLSFAVSKEFRNVGNRILRHPRMSMSSFLHLYVSTKCDVHLPCSNNAYNEQASVMASIKLENLPRELIVHIATFVEALSIINLSRTSKTIRSAVWDSLIFKEILQRSQCENWRNDSLDIDAIAKRAGTDPCIWSRYAVADDKAWVLTGMKDPLLSRKLSINFLPELAVVKHPFMNRSCWCMATHGPFDYLTSHVFSLATAALSADERVLDRWHDPGHCEYCYPKPRENDPAFLNGEGSLWTLCSMAIALRDALKMRRLAWPYNHVANTPHVDFPRADTISLRPLKDDYVLPLPFSHRAVELLSKPTSGLSGWDTWYRRHCHAMYSSPEFLTDGSWCGYYIWTNSHQASVEPPMTNIHFQRSIPKVEADCEAALIWADDCIDGVGPFILRGSISFDGNVVSVSAFKNYVGGPIWEWDCRLTPFGIVGHWGKNIEEEFRTYGYVWLWKEEWARERATSGDG